VAQFKKPVAKRLGQRFSVILAVSQFRQTGNHRRKVIRINDLRSSREGFFQTRTR
jgi:hypothetical protein